jgi:hypothetical protein
MAEAGTLTLSMQFDAKFISTAWSGLTALAGVWLGQRLASRSTERQRVWNQKRDTYASLLSAISELDLVAGSLGMYLAMERTEHTLNEVSKLDNRLYDVLRDSGRAAACFSERKQSRSWTTY